MAWEIEQHGRNLHRINFDLLHVDDEQHVLLMSDVHFDSPHCDREMAIRHLEEAKAIGAPVLDAGDFFDVMQGKYDRRSDKKDLRPELVGGPSSYLDECVSQSVEWLAPYKDILTVRGVGNHESAIAKRHETHLVERQVALLREMGSRSVHLGGYGGYVVFRPTAGQSCRRCFDLYYFHGSGGGGPVTKGVIQTNRRAASVDADIMWTGHVHEQWVLWQRRLRRRMSMTITQTDQAHVCTPGYKNEYGDGFGGWHVETGKPPKPIGAYWLRFFRLGGEGHRVGFDFREAK